MRVTRRRSSSSSTNSGTWNGPSAVGMEVEHVEDAEEAARTAMTTQL
jgi:hypothetical protein